jgi:carbon-monoxide dehydrogenase medium subunit
MASHNEVLGSPDVARDCPLMIEAYQQVAHHSIRNRGTFGGSLCHNDPSAEMPLVVTMLSATLVARSTAGERRLAADEFFLGMFATALRPDELLVEIAIPIPPKEHGWSFQEISQRHGDFALIAAAAMLTVKDGLCHNVRIGYRNVGTSGGRLAAIEAIVEGQAPTPSLFNKAAEAARAAIDPPSDIHADAEYRRDVAGTLTRRALAAAVTRAR